MRVYPMPDPWRPRRTWRFTHGRSTSKMSPTYDSEHTRIALTPTGMKELRLKFPAPLYWSRGPGGRLQIHRTHVQ
jgi:hypothetical protein